MNMNPNRVMRGGSWYDSARYCRSAYRIYYEPDYRSRYVGFRPVLKQKMTPNKSKPSRVMRGGCWNNDTRSCRSTYHFYVVLDYQCQSIGFRPAIKKTQQNDHH